MSKVQKLSRRRFLQLTAVSGSALALAACTVPMPAGHDGGMMHDDMADAPAMEDDGKMDGMADMEADVLVGDVLDYTFHSDDWAGPYGSVTMMLHEAMYNGESAYYIRTDSSDQAHAEAEQLVYVPLLATGAAIDTNTICMFSDDRPPVISRIPGDENYSSLFKVMNVEVLDSSATLDSHEAVMAAVEGGAASGEDTGVFVNHPLISWPGGSMPVDSEQEGVLKNGQLFAEPDMMNMSVTMKLHECYPNSRYILTDSGMMAGMMSISDATITNELKDVGGTDEVWVFGNGIPGPGVMGFQPAVFDHSAGDPAWSPFWDHFTLVWNDEANARVLTSGDEVRAAVEAGEVEQFNGVPDSHPTGFVVNCPVVISAATHFADMM